VTAFILWKKGVFGEEEKEVTYLLSKETRYNSDGSIDYWSEPEYDENGNELKRTYFNSDGCISRWFEFEHDENDNLTKETEFYSDGSISCWYEYEYVEAEE